MKLPPGCYLLSILIAFTLSGCAGSGVSGDDYALIANPPKLENVTPTISEQTDDRAFSERYQWTYRPGGWPAADLVFVRIKAMYGGRLSYIKQNTLADHIHASFTARTITLGSTGTAKNAVGSLGYQHFGVDTVADCVFIEQGVSRFADQFEFQPGINQEPLGDMFIRGWYCVPPATPNQFGLFSEFINSIGIHGYAVP